MEADTHSSLIDNILTIYPVVQVVHILIVAIVIPPVILLLTQLSKIALHDNCRFLMHAWATAFVLSIGCHLAFVICDFANGKYITERNEDPPSRLLIFAVHGFAHAMSSAQELMLSIERTVSCAVPQYYHDQRLAKRVLFVAESISVGVSMFFLWQISQANVLIACYIINTIDLASLICLSSTTCYVTRRKKTILESSLNEKYQIREAFEVTRVMLPCGVISLVMKVASTLAPWIYALQIFDSKYTFTLTAGAYFAIESLNCMICSIVVLTRHSGMRRLTRRLLCGKTTSSICREHSTGETSSLYFAALRKEWN